MNIEALNQWGRQMFEFAGCIFLQSSVLIAIVWMVDFALRRRLRAAVRYALWLAVLVKLVTPPSLALPTGLSWWLISDTPVQSNGISISVTSAQEPGANPASRSVSPAFVIQNAAISPTVWTLAACAGISLALLGWMALRWRHVARSVRQATPAHESLNEILEQARQTCGLRYKVQLRLTEAAMSPAVCGLFRPVIMVPRVLAEQLSPDQMRAVLVHELIHLQRGDVWVNCAQALLQIFYWWHPLVWLGNARIRRVREEAVDDAVAVALPDGADTYAPTLLEVAKLAFSLPQASLGLIGIFESRNALKQRIERLLTSKTPRKAGLTLLSLLCIAAFIALTVPMGKAPVSKKEAPDLNARVLPERLPLLIETNAPAKGNLSDNNGPQIRIDVKFVELENFNPATEPSESPLRILPLEVSNNALAAQTEAAKALRAKFQQPERLRLTTDANPTVMKTLSETEARQFVKMLGQRPGTDILPESPVTTTDGRRTRVSTANMMTVVTGVETELDEAASKAAVSYLTEKFSCGPAVTFQPQLESDQRTITLQVHGCTVGFLGYDKPEKTEKSEIKKPNGESLKFVPPLPRFQLLEVVGKASIGDGQTLLLAGPVFYKTIKMKDSVPVLSALPLLGNSFTSESTARIKTHLVVLITPTIIDNTGKPLYPERHARGLTNRLGD